MPLKTNGPGDTRGYAQARGLRTRKAYQARRFSDPLPTNWRALLPDPARFYAQHVAKMGKVNQAGWARGLCPFHDDSNASLSVNLCDKRAGWRCFAGCGGSDLVGFHMRKTGKSFRDAVADLLAMRP